MTDYSALRRLAHEASETEMGWLDRDWLSGIMADDWADYVSAIDPQVVIDMIDENERLTEEVEVGDKIIAERDRLLAAIPECAANGQCVPYAIQWVRDIQVERDQLKAENERMRLALKSAEDAMWKSESNMDNEAADIRDLLAAMSKGEQA